MRQNCPRGGELGRERYHQRLASLFHDAPAYEAYDQAVKAFEKNELKAAHTFVDKAIRILPEEPLFHLLKGRVLEREGERDKAVAAYRNAVKLNPEYYESHLYLGLLLDALGNQVEARNELRSSVRLLKTAIALYHLGMMAHRDHDDLLAKYYFKEAATSDTEYGRAAYKQLLLIDLPYNAGAYLQARFVNIEKNALGLLITNATPFPMTDVTVAFDTSTGRVSYRIDGVISASGMEIIHIDPKVSASIQSAEVQVISARLEGS